MQDVVRLNTNIVEIFRRYYLHLWKTFNNFVDDTCLRFRNLRRQIFYLQEREKKREEEEEEEREKWTGGGEIAAGALERTTTTSASLLLKA